MTIADTYVRARIDMATKNKASDALEAMGLSISDAIRMLMLRIADEHLKKTLNVSMQTQRIARILIAYY